MTVREMLERMDSRELTEWMAHDYLLANPPPKVQSPSEIRSVLSQMVKPKKRR